MERQEEWEGGVTGVEVPGTGAPGLAKYSVRVIRDKSWPPSLQFRRADQVGAPSSSR